jgi:hypothetical protein
MMMEGKNGRRKKHLALPPSVYHQSPPFLLQQQQPDGRTNVDSFSIINSFSSPLRRRRRFYFFASTASWVVTAAAVWLAGTNLEEQDCHE